MERTGNPIREKLRAGGGQLQEVLRLLLPVTGSMYCFSHAASALRLCAELMADVVHFAGGVPEELWILLWFLAAFILSFSDLRERLFIWKKWSCLPQMLAAAGAAVLLASAPSAVLLPVLTVTTGLALEYLRNISLRAASFLTRSCGFSEAPGDNRRYLPWAVLCLLILFASAGFADRTAVIGYYLAWNIQILWPWLLAGLCIRRAMNFGCSGRNGRGGWCSGLPEKNR